MGDLTEQAVLWTGPSAHVGPGELEVSPGCRMGELSVDWTAERFTGHADMVCEDAEPQVLAARTRWDGPLLLTTPAGLQLIDGQAGVWTPVPRAETGPELLWRYLTLGARHVGAGLDHLLVMAGLVVATGARARAVVWLSGAFTLGHGLTLAAVALTAVALPRVLVEGGICLTLVWLGWQLWRDRSAHAPGAALIVGLLHGLGFGGALDEVGLPLSVRLGALAAFNVGVEVVQLAVIAACWVLLSQIGRPRMAPVVSVALGAVGVAGLLDLA